MESQVEQPRVQRGHQKERRSSRVGYEKEIWAESEEEDRSTRCSRERFQFGSREDRFGEWVDNNLGNIKIKIPSFQGRSDPKAYLELEKILDSKLKKVKLLSIEFIEYAIV